jgi:hypothetical protein
VLVSLDIILVNPVRPRYDPDRQLAVANQAFAPCRVQFFVEQVSNVDPQITNVLIGPRHEVSRSLDSDSLANRIVRTAPDILRARIKVIFVANIEMFAGFSIGRSLDALRGGNLGERVFIRDDSREDTMAHELGHVLLDDASETHHPSPDNLMAEGTIRTAQNLDNSQRRRISDNAQRSILRVR